MDLQTQTTEFNVQSAKAPKMHMRPARMISRQQPYVKMLCEDYNGDALTEEQGAANKGKWAEVFGNSNPIDLEIGTGSGHFFAYQTLKEPQRNLLGIELKFKPLIQAIQKCQQHPQKNFRIVRFRAEFLPVLVTPNEIENVFIHFPDPWPKRAQKKHRLLNAKFFTDLFALQKPGSFLQIKTDSRDYFDFILSEIKKTPYSNKSVSFDFHADKLQANPQGEFIKSRETPPTQFEGIFLAQDLPIHFGFWLKP
jgi:tRNA (guanine-N7-)-methyltransferase